MDKNLAFGKVLGKNVSRAHLNFADIEVYVFRVGVVIGIIV